MSNGWISIHRQLLDHWLWQENREFSKAEAWIDILLSVNHTPQELVIKTTVYKVGRGESLMSLDTWAKRWNWNKSKVRRFFKLLEEQSMVVVKSETQTTRLTVCKYDSYQVPRNANETQVKQKRNASETQTTPNNNDNKEINIPFIDFWNLYDKKRGSRSSCEKKWNRLKDSEREEIMETLPNFKKSVSDIQFLPYPETYLNGRRWEDVIEQREPKRATGQFRDHLC